MDLCFSSLRGLHSFTHSFTKDILISDHRRMKRAQLTLPICPASASKISIGPIRSRRTMAGKEGNAKASLPFSPSSVQGLS